MRATDKPFNIDKYRYDRHVCLMGAG